MVAAHLYKDDRSIADISRDDERLRNIKRARIAHQKKQREMEYMKKLSKNVNVSKQNIFKNRPQTDAQQKQKLKKASIKNTLKNRGRKKRIIRQIKKNTRIIKKHKNVSWMLLWVASAVSFFGGFFTEFLIGYVFTIPASLYITVKLWSLFNGVERRRNRAVAVIASAIKLIPILSIFPSQIYYIYFSKKMSEEKIEISKKKVKILQKRLRRML